MSFAALARKTAGAAPVTKSNAPSNDLRIGGTSESFEQEKERANAPPIVHEVLRSPGQPLDEITRAFMEPRFSYDFSKVRIHTDGPASESAQAVNAAAYTVGRDVVFGRGNFDPRSSVGRKLLAHELAHTVQVPSLPDEGRLLQIEPPGSRREVAARRAANAVLSGGPAAIGQSAPGIPTLFRQEIDVEWEGDPRTSIDYIDKNVIAVAYGIFVGGFLVFCKGMPFPFLVREDEVDFGSSQYDSVGSEIYPDRETAIKAVPFGPYQGAIPYAYFRAPRSSMIAPTMFSAATAPRLVQTAREAVTKLVKEVQDELVVMALFIAGGLVVSAAISRIVRVGEAPAVPEGTPPRAGQGQDAPPVAKPLAGEAEPGLPAAKGGAPKNPVALGEEIGAEVKALPTGKRATIAKRVSGANLSQDEAVIATGEASKRAFGRIGGPVTLPNGDIVVPSVSVGSDQPVFVVKPTGQVLPARATISTAQPVDLANPLRITDVKLE